MVEVWQLDTGSHWKLGQNDLTLDLWLDCKVVLKVRGHLYKNILSPFLQATFALLSKVSICKSMWNWMGLLFPLKHWQQQMVHSSFCCTDNDLLG